MPGKNRNTNNQWHGAFRHAICQYQTEIISKEGLADNEEIDHWNKKVSIHAVLAHHVFNLKNISLKV